MSSEATEILAESKSIGSADRNHCGPTECRQVNFVQQAYGQPQVNCRRSARHYPRSYLRPVEWRNRMFKLVDTGGIVPDDEAVIPRNIFIQAHTAIAEARLILFMVDARAGLTSLDEEIVEMLRPLGRRSS